MSGLQRGLNLWPREVITAMIIAYLISNPQFNIWNISYITSYWILSSREKFVQWQHFYQSYFAFSFADRCNMPLGLADRRIPNPLITASSYHSFYCGPWNARLHQRRVSRFGGSWCARTNNQKQYLQVSDLITCLEHSWVKVVCLLRIIAKHAIVTKVFPERFCNMHKRFEIFVAPNRLL